MAFRKKYQNIEDVFLSSIGSKDSSSREKMIDLYIASEVERIRRRRTHRWVILIVLLVIAVFALAGVILTGDLGHGIKTGVSQVTLYGADTLNVDSKYIGMLHIEGEISQDATATYDQEWLLARVKEMQSDSNNRGMLLYIDSPGGSSYATNQFYRALKDYQKKTKRPIYAYIASEGASGGYYIACAADRIYMNEEGWAGSIGVRSGTIYDVTGLMRKLGIKSETIHAGRNKLMGSPTEKLTREQRQILQGLIDDSYDRFVDVVATERGMTTHRARSLADGRIYTATQSKRLDLIDGIADFSTTKANMQASSEKLAGVPILDIVHGQTTTFSLTDLLNLCSSTDKDQSPLTTESGSTANGSSATGNSGATISQSGSDSTKAELLLLQQLMEHNNSLDVQYLAPVRK